MIRGLLHIVLSFTVLGLQGQVIVDKPVVLDGPTPEQRQVTGLMPGTVASAPITAGTEQSGLHRTAVADQTNNWQLDLPALAGPPSAGTHVIVIVPTSASTGPVQLTVNTDGPYPVLVAPGTPFLAESALNSPSLSLVFDGTAFQVMNGRARQRRECPTGMVAVNDQYCVDISESDTTDFFTAGIACVSQNKRMCTWGEWYGACTLGTTLGLLNINDNWEWTGDAANEDNGARIVGASCSSAGTWSIFNAAQAYRCCYTR